MKLYFLFLSMLSVMTMSQSLDFKNDVKSFQKELNTEYLTKETSPLRGENFKKFEAHPFFPIQKKYQVIAKLEKTKDVVEVNFPTSSGQVKIYKEYGKLYFNLNGENNVLTVYTSEDLAKVPGYEDYLFLPFRDKTNGQQTYGGGKYIDLRIPTGDTVIIDFNKSYQPYCAYNAQDYSCPIVPDNNHLKIAIKAGVKYDDVYFN